MSNYDKNIQRENEIDAWEAFKYTVEKCLVLGFNKDQLIGHINIKSCAIKGEL